MRTVVSLIEAEYRRYKTLGEGAMDQLEVEQLAAGAAPANSVATLVWHIAGNLESRFTDFLTADGEKPWRDRESEFQPRDVPRVELMEKWERGWGVLFDSLGSLNDEDLPRPISIRGVELRVDEALFRSLAHTSYHVGQIVAAAKGFLGESWRYMSIPPGGSAAYNKNPIYEKASRLGSTAGEGSED